MSEKLLETVDRLDRARWLLRAVELGICGLQMDHERDALGTAMANALDLLSEGIASVNAIRLDRQDSEEAQP